MDLAVEEGLRITHACLTEILVMTYQLERDGKVNCACLTICVAPLLTVPSMLRCGGHAMMSTNVLVLLDRFLQGLC